MGKVDRELYDFLIDSECGIQLIEGSVVAHVHMYLWEVEIFNEILNNHSWLDEPCEDFQMHRDSLCFYGLMDLIEYIGDDIRYYEECFDERDWMNIVEYLKEEE